VSDTPTTSTDHRKVSQGLADAIRERRSRALAIGSEQVLTLILAQQRFLVALDDELRALCREEIGRG
jgi:hypothetical protein